MKVSIHWLLTAIAVGLTLTPAHSKALRLELIVPAYFYPTDGEPHWPALAKAVQRVPITAILNPNSGPGAAIDPNYINATRMLQKAGGQIVGYVHTQYGRRSIADVVADMQRYMDWYPIDGFFIDEMSNQDDPALITYYRRIFDFAKRMNPTRTYRVIGNPGTYTAPNYLNAPVADALIITEGAKRAYKRYPVAQWTLRMPAARLGHLSYGIPNAKEMRQVIGDALNRNAGMVYVTNDVAPNPWDSLPNYWAQQVNCVAAINQGRRDC